MARWLGNTTEYLTDMVTCIINQEFSHLFHLKQITSYYLTFQLNAVCRVLNISIAFLQIIFISCILNNLN